MIDDGIDDGADDGADAKGESFRFRWMTERRAGRATLFSRLSVGALILPLLLVYGVGSILDANALFGGSVESLDLAMSLFVSGALASIGLALVSVAVGAERTRTGGVITVRGDRVAIEHLDSVEHMGLRRIAGGLRLPSTAVELYLTDGRVLRADMKSEREARAVLDRLGVGPEGRRLVAPEVRPSRVLGVGCAAFPIAFVLFANAIVALQSVFSGAGPVVVTLLVIATTLVARRFARGAEMVIGAEGVAVRQVGASAKIARFDEIARVLRSGRVLTLVLRDDAKGRPRRPIREACADADVAEGLAARIEEQIERAGRGPRVAPLAELLAPGDRPVAAWRASLAGLLRGSDRYRSAAVDGDDLLTLVEDASAPPKIRIGAAIALRDRLAEGDRARVRVAADACADPSLREALEAAAAEEEIDDAVIRKVIG